jgi:hypothetical protein
MYAKPSEILVLILVKPSLPANTLEILRPKAKAKEQKKEIKDKVQRQRNREAEVAKDIVKQADEAKSWCKEFLATKLENTELDKDESAQKAISTYAGAMGLPEEGHALTDNFGRWCRTLSGYVVGKTETENKAGNDEIQLGDMPQLVLKKLLKPRKRGPSRICAPWRRRPLFENVERHSKIRRGDRRVVQDTQGQALCIRTPHKIHQRIPRERYAARPARLEDA